MVSNGWVTVCSYPPDWWLDYWYKDGGREAYWGYERGEMTFEAWRSHAERYKRLYKS